MLNSSRFIRIFLRIQLLIKYCRWLNFIRSSNWIAGHRYQITSETLLSIGLPSNISALSLSLSTLHQYNYRIYWKCNNICGILALNSERLDQWIFLWYDCASLFYKLHNHKSCIVKVFHKIHAKEVDHWPSELLTSSQ